MTTKTHSWYAERYTSRYNWQLVPLKPNSKLPILNDWGNETLNGTASDYYAKNPTHNIGVALGPSLMCSLDIDCEASFQELLKEYGIPTDELDAMPTIRGKGKRLLFRMPAGSSLNYAKLNWPSRNDPTGDIHKRLMKLAATAKADGDTTRERRLRAIAKRYRIYTVFELRISTDSKQRFDVLPPSMHPDTGKPYSWSVQPPATLDAWPEPPAWLLAIWEAWESFKPQFRDACPWSVKPEAIPAKAISRTVSVSDGDTPIETYLKHNTLVEALSVYGYRQIGRRWLSPHSATGLPGVTVMPSETSCWIHHASDPLCSEETGKPVNAFDLYCHYEHGDDASAACKQIAQVYELNNKSRPTPEPIPAITDGLPPLMPFDDLVPGAEVGYISDTPATLPTAEPPKQEPFLALGYSGTHYYYLPRGTEQVVELKRGAHTSPAELMALASIEWWESHYPKQTKSPGVDWQMAASCLMRACERAGIYSPERQRGRGAWHDQGRAVLHLGDHLLVDGVRTTISDHASKYIYTRGAATASGIAAEPLPASESVKVRGIVSKLAWVKPIHAELLLGWCALAPICGALSWRPHIWLTTQRGGGKSWLQSRIVHPLIGSMGLVVQGATTEAGIRQRVASDARSVMFDEAEAENQRGGMRIQSIMELARQSSSDSGAEIVKGSANGAAMSFRMRSMFFMASINVAISQAADESRFSVLQLAKPQMDSAQFSEFEAETDALLTREYTAALRARMYRMIPTVRESAKTLANAIADLLGSQRMGDQVGTLLAGCWCLENDEPISDSAAAYWVSQLDFSDAEEAEQVSDEEACLQTLLQAHVRHEEGSYTSSRTVGELIDQAQSSDNIEASCAQLTLSRHGFRVENDQLVISNTHHEIKKMLSDSPWSGGWRRIISRLPGAESLQKPVRFAGSTTRAISVPITW